MSVKYVFVTGGVVSGLGKGITAASLGRLLKERGYRVTIQKFDPYINVDPGMMCPFQHGEVFVTDDGAEGDLDLGHYERFVDVNLSVYSNITSGKVYWNVINKERRGEYGGGTVQVIPHITNNIKERVYRVGQDDCDIVITEIGGTVGDIEGLPFLEAIRQVAKEVGRDNCCFVHVTLVPYIASSQEVKTKPTQHSVKELLSLGIQPNVIVCRSEQEISKENREKLALFCNVRPEDVVPNMTAPSLYEVPLWLEKEGLAKSVCHHLRLEDKTPKLKEWNAMVKRQKAATDEVTIGLFGKYVELRDAYLSLAESLTHGGIINDIKVNIKWIDSLEIAEKGESALKGCHGLVTSGAFDEEQGDELYTAIKYAREQNIPFLGICLGMQAAIVEFARNVVKIKKADSVQFNEKCEDPIIVLHKEAEENQNIMKSTRLGLFPCKLATDTLCREIYGEELIYERHRHRHEVNIHYKSDLEKAGMVIAGMSPDEHLIEAVELPKHPFFVGVQFDPEYKSRPNRPHPLVAAFIGAAIKNMKE